VGEDAVASTFACAFTKIWVDLACALTLLFVVDLWIHLEDKLLKFVQSIRHFWPFMDNVSVFSRLLDFVCCVQFMLTKEQTAQNSWSLQQENVETLMYLTIVGQCPGKVSI